MNKLLGALAVAAILSAAGAAQASILYSNGFESASTANITGVTTITSAPNGQNYLGQLAQGGTSTLTVNTSGYTNVNLSFDLYAINSLDGDGSSYCCGPDIFTLKANASTLLSNTFSNSLYWTQNYGGAGSAGGTGSDGGLVNALGYNYGGYGPDHTYHLSFNLGSPGASAIFDFIGNTNQPAYDEGFGIDNIVVTGDRGDVVPEPASWALMILGLGGVGAALRNRRRVFAAI